MLLCQKVFFLVFLCRLFPCLSWQLILPPHIAYVRYDITALMLSVTSSRGIGTSSSVQTTVNRSGGSSIVSTDTTALARESL
mmetsp:Transcript_32695/g.46469  ORF Transcript_32695/g.46469 Transcript_32695/m.46469 type:complete len:82 (-) Transcript_32695:917-1162(-)